MQCKYFFANIALLTTGAVCHIRVGTGMFVRVLDYDEWAGVWNPSEGIA